MTLGPGMKLAFLARYAVNQRGFDRLADWPPFRQGACRIAPVIDIDTAAARPLGELDRSRQAGFLLDDLGNGATRDYNNRVERFPDQFIARSFGFRRGEFFQAEAGSRSTVQIKVES